MCLEGKIDTGMDLSRQLYCCKIQRCKGGTVQDQLYQRTCPDYTDSIAYYPQKRQWYQGHTGDMQAFYSSIPSQRHSYRRYIGQNKLMWRVTQFLPTSQKDTESQPESLEGSSYLPDIADPPHSHRRSPQDTN